MCDFHEHRELTWFVATSRSWGLMVLTHKERLALSGKAYHYLAWFVAIQSVKDP